MDVSAEAADLVVKESIQAAESVLKLAGHGIKNVAALLLALKKEDYKVVGKASIKRLSSDPTPTVVVPLKKEDMKRFEKLAKEYGVLYFMAQKKGNDSGYVNIISNQNYAAQINAVMETMNYPIPQQVKGEEAPKKAHPRAPRESSSPEHGSGLNPSMEKNEQKPSVKKRLEGLKAANQAQTPQKQIPKKKR